LIVGVGHVIVERDRDLVLGEARQAFLPAKSTVSRLTTSVCGRSIVGNTYSSEAAGRRSRTRFGAGEMPGNHC
jgi:hypothetical protein